MLILDLDDSEKRISLNIVSKNFYKELDRIKKIPGSKYNPEKKEWTVPKNKSTLNRLKRDFKIGYQQHEYKLLGKKEPKVATAADILINSIEEKDINDYLEKLEIDKMKLQLRPFQKLAVASAKLFLDNIGGFLIADSMGLGKTIEALGIIFQFKKEKKINKVLVSCPKNVKYQWAHETRKFTDLEPVVIDGYNKQKRLECFDKSGDIYIINHDQLVLKDDFKMMKDKIKPNMIVVDEAHYFKNRSTKRAKQLKKLSKKSDYKLALTGTPIQNHPSDLFSVYEYLLGDKFCSWKKFKKDYIIYSYMYNYPMEIGYKNLFDLKKKASKFMIRRLTEDVGNEIPSVNKKNKIIPMSLDQQEISIELQDSIDDFKEKEKRLRKKNKDNDEEIEELEGKVLGYKNIQAEVANDLRLLKGSDSYVCKKAIEGKSLRMSNKTREFLEITNKILKENKNHKIVVFSRFATMVQLLKKELLNKNISKEVAVLYGDLNEKQRDKEIQNFKNNDECRIIVMSDAGCTGINLQNASHLINFELPWNPAILDQRNGRIRRIGSPWDEVSIINLISKDSIDEKVYQAIEKKRETVDKIIENSKSQTESLKKIASEII